MEHRLREFDVNMSSAIELIGLSKRFTERSLRLFLSGKHGKTVRALEDITFSVEPGKVFGLIGPNGAGKTTLVKILATLIIPDGGTARICGHDVFSDGARIREKIGLVNTNQRSFYWRLTGRQNLSFYAHLYNLRSEDRNKRVDDLLDFVGLADKADTRFMKYSTGQQQRLALARALLSDPRVLLMDEPTSSLDPSARIELRKFVKNDLAAARGKTILWCTHDLEEASDLCNRLAVLHQGRILAQGTIGEMKSLLAASTRYRFKIDRVPEHLPSTLHLSDAAIHAHNGHFHIELDAAEAAIPDIIDYMVATNIRVYSCEPIEITLEAIFQDLIHRAESVSSNGPHNNPRRHFANLSGNHHIAPKAGDLSDRN